MRQINKALVRKLIQENNKIKSAVWANNHKKLQKAFEEIQAPINMKQVYIVVELANKVRNEIYY